MSGDVNSFSLPAGKRVKICAEEGTVKAKTNPKRVSIIKKELCKVDTPVPKFVRPKRPPLRSDLSKEQNDVIKDLKLPKDDNVKIKYPISFNGKTRFTISLPADMTKEQVENAVMNNEKTNQYLNEKSPKKIIVVPKRIVNIVV